MTEASKQDLAGFLGHPEIKQWYDSLPFVEPKPRPRISGFYNE